MHQYLEMVRNEIESAAGQEKYLASALFLKVFREVPYEDDGDFELTDKAGFEEIQNRVTNILRSPSDFDPKEELLSWQIAVLRQMARDFYNIWVDYKDERFGASDIFSDGESCMSLEASLEKINEDPTENYSAILEIEQTLTKLATSPTQFVTELDKFWSFKGAISSKGDGVTAFTQKRIDLEKNGTMIAAVVRGMKEVSNRCERNARQLPGAHHLLWINAHILVESFTNAFESFLEFEYLDNIELSLHHWLDTLFPQRMIANLPNPLHQSPTHHGIIANLTQATQCMVQYVAHGNQAFDQRDEIIVPHVLEALERVKRISLKNITALQRQEMQTKAFS